MTSNSSAMVSTDRLAGTDIPSLQAGVSSPFAAFSGSIARLVAAAAPCLIAVRIGGNRHVTGLLWQDNVITADQALPVLDRYAIVLPTGGQLAARPGQRGRGAAVLKLDTPAGRSPLTLGQPVLGGFAVVLAADAQAAPTVRLTTVHRIARVGHTAVAVLDLAPHQVDLGAVALDADGRLIGIVASGTNGEAILVPPASIGDVIQLARSAAAEVQPLTQTPARGWLGLALQPITVPEPLAARAGQTSARMIVKITAGGPAEHGGLMVGDVLLTLNDISVTGSHSLRAFLTGDKIGCPVNARVLRDGTLFTTQLIVAPPPG